jgi:hypothetical protein
MTEHEPDGHEDRHAPGDAPKPDTSPPRERLILVLVLATVSSLWALKYGFDSYLDRELHLTREEHLDNSTAAIALADYREEAASTLAGGAMSIDEAMEQLGTRGRTAFVQIRPAPGDPSRAAREGWASLPVAPPEAAPTPTRTTFTLPIDHMPPPDPELDALDAAADAPPTLGEPL